MKHQCWINQVKNNIHQEYRGYPDQRQDSVGLLPGDGGDGATAPGHEEQLQQQVPGVQADPGRGG